MVLMYLSKRLWRAALNAIWGYVYIPWCRVSSEVYPNGYGLCGYTAPIDMLPLNFQIPRFCG
jgi:hypothetical protein|nr:MAG TPA: hypothetical protein [Caudoviricetes sp.]